jgi:hypothetical protein
VLTWVVILSCYPRRFLPSIYTRSHSHSGSHSTPTQKNPPLCFHALTWNLFCNPFVFTFMHVMGGVRVCVATGLDAALILPERRSAGWPIFWSTTRSKPICCHRQPAIAPDGNIFFTTDQGYAYGVSDAGSPPMDSPWPRFQHDAQNSGHARF